MKHFRQECSKCGMVIAVESATDRRMPHLDPAGVKCKASGKRVGTGSSGTRRLAAPMAQCLVCDMLVKVRSRGRAYSHNDPSTGRLCDGSDAIMGAANVTGPIAQIVEVTQRLNRDQITPIDVSRRSSATSVHTVTGGLPSSNRRRH